MIKRDDPLFPAETTGMIAETSPRPHLTVKEMAYDERPRERALQLGFGALKNSELFAIILRTGAQNITITDLCRRMMAENGDSLKMLARRDRRQLMEYPGIGTSKALQIEAVMELVKRFNKELNNDNRIIRCSSDINTLIRDNISNLEYEELWVVFLNNRNEAFEMRRLTIGSTNATMFDVKRMMKYAVLEMAQGLILCHNHPSGSLSPSPQDVNITERTKKACEFFDMRLLDHVIITADSYYSFADNGRL